MLPKKMVKGFLELKSFEKFRNGMIELKQIGYTKKSLQDTLDIQFEQAGLSREEATQ
jgi:hypothetical protein